MQYAKCQTVSSCPNCATLALTRNHYFTGKLMVERDFTDEQRYFLERLRLHNQRLHGTGVACGLSVEQHDNPACQDKFVFLEPGSAIDCCGHDILVPERDTIDIRAFPAVKALIDKPDGKDHVLQFCICYRDCPTEEIPVLYDECGCDDSQCAPNRILESYAIDVKVDPPTTTKSVDGPSLRRDGTIGVAYAWAVALDAAGDRVFVLSGPDNAAIYQISASTNVVETSYSFGRRVFTIVLSPDGKTLYAVVASSPLGSDSELWVFDVSGASTLSSVAPKHGVIAGSGFNPPVVAVSKNGVLLVGCSNGNVYAWNAGAAPGAPTAKNTLGASVQITDIACSSDGKKAWVASNLSPMFYTLDLFAADLAPKPTNVSGATLHRLAVVASAAPDLLLATDTVSNEVHLVDPTSPSGTAPMASVDVARMPDEVVASADGAWAYVNILAAAVDQPDSIQVIDVGKMRSGVAQTASAPFDVAVSPTELVITPTGDRLYVPYPGQNATGTDGGVAVLDITSGDCLRCLHHVCPCPQCDHADCVVLATVKGWQPGRKLLDPVDPPPSASDDAKNGIARIDDMDGRVVLASTQTLQNAIECLVEHGVGGGKTGPAGKNGVDGTNGKNGLGLDIDVPRINAISWNHGGTGGLVPVESATAPARGIVIGFTHDIRIVPPPGSGSFDPSYNRNVFQVWVPDPKGTKGLICRCQLDGLIHLVNPKTDASNRIVGAIIASTPSAPGLAFVPRTEDFFRESAEIWIRLLGELVMDDNKNAVDGSFVRGILPTGVRGAFPSPPIDPTDIATIDKLPGVQGAHFESWLIYRKG